MSLVVERLARHTGLTMNDVRRIMSSAPIRYKVYEIPKRAGGFREIAQPAREVKLLQKAFVEEFVRDLPIHECATAYRPGASVYENARRHAGGGRPILKLDFKAFFPSIRSRDWATYCRSHLKLSEEDVLLSSDLLFRSSKKLRGLRLAIGAPSSPHLSNLLMYDFDDQIQTFAASEKVIYTRYADDLTFSAARTGYLTHIVAHVRSTLRKMRSPQLTLNETKTTFVTAKYGRRVTGLVLTNEGKVSIGHDKKRTLRATVHRALLGQLSTEEVEKLAGMLAYVNSVERSYVEGLRRKFGQDEIARLISTKRLRDWKPDDSDLSS